MVSEIVSSLTGLGVNAQRENLRINSHQFIEAVVEIVHKTCTIPPII